MGSKEGFVITLTGRTPNADGFEFLRKTFCEGLRKAKEGKEAYVAAEVCNEILTPASKRFACRRSSVECAIDAESLNGSRYPRERRA